MSTDAQRLVVLDIDDTLLDTAHAYEALERYVCDATACSERAFAAAYRKHRPFSFGHLAQELPGLDVAALTTHMREVYSSLIYDDVRASVAEFVEQGCRVVALTYGAEEVQQLKIDALQSLGVLFHEVHVVAQPEHKERVLQEYIERGVYQEIYFVDDHPTQFGAWIDMATQLYAYRMQRPQGRHNSEALPEHSAQAVTVIHALAPVVAQITQTEASQERAFKIA